MRVVPGNAQHVGDRENQQDSFGFSDFGDRTFARHGGYMMVLCDGMGGLANGARASRAAVETVIAAYQRKEPSESIVSALQRSVDDAQRAVRAVATEDGSAGTTLVAAVICDDRLYWASLGDSRLYLCRAGAEAVQLTEDHNVASEMARRSRRGGGSGREVMHAGNPEALTAYLGSPEAVVPHTGRSDGLPLRAGDRIVACSDGLYRGIAPEAMTALAVRDTPMRAAQGMIEAVLNRRLQHQDNVTVVVLQVASAGRLLPMPRTVGGGVAAGAVGGSAATLLVILALYAVVGPRTHTVVVPPPPHDRIPAKVPASHPQHRPEFPAKPNAPVTIPAMRPVPVPPVKPEGPGQSQPNPEAGPSTLHPKTQAGNGKAQTPAEKRPEGKPPSAYTNGTSTRVTTKTDHGGKKTADLLPLPPPPPPTPPQLPHRKSPPT